MTLRIFFYYNVKDNFPHKQRNKIIYTIKCPGYGENTTVKQRDTLYLVWISMENETLSPCSNIFKNAKCLKKHVLCMLFYQYTMKMIRWKRSHILSTVLQNQEIINLDYNWSKLLVLKTFNIKKHDPVKIYDLKSSREFLSFRW